MEQPVERNEHLEIAWYKDGKEKFFIRVQMETLKGLFGNIDLKAVRGAIEKVEKLTSVEREE